MLASGVKWAPLVVMDQSTPAADMTPAADADETVARLMVSLAADHLPTMVPDKLVGPIYKVLSFQRCTAAASDGRRSCFKSTTGGDS